ncbi:MAG TPA: hypothetical protein VNN25_16195 [Thermoanaerobaculia bacterium]|nr:hypothetical protein [Thermoanaerobaculia bacterium]
MILLRPPTPDSRRPQYASNAHTAINSGSHRKYGKTGTSPAPIAQSARITAAMSPPVDAVTSAAIGTSIASAAASSTVSSRRVFFGDGLLPRTNASRPPSVAKP